MYRRTLLSLGALIAGIGHGVRSIVVGDTQIVPNPKTHVIRGSWDFGNRGEYRGSLRARRSKAEHVRRIAAAQAKRERRRSRNLRIAQGA
jgi:hypothetical protein